MCDRARRNCSASLSSGQKSINSCADGKVDRATVLLSPLVAAAARRAQGCCASLHTTFPFLLSSPTASQVPLRPAAVQTKE